MLNILVTLLEDQNHIFQRFTILVYYFKSLLSFFFYLFILSYRKWHPGYLIGNLAWLFEMVLHDGNLPVETSLKMDKTNYFGC